MSEQASERHTSQFNEQKINLDLDVECCYMDAILYYIESEIHWMVAFIIHHHSPYHITTVCTPCTKSTHQHQCILLYDVRMNKENHEKMRFLIDNCESYIKVLSLRLSSSFSSSVLMWNDTWADEFIRIRDQGLDGRTKLVI